MGDLKRFVGVSLVYKMDFVEEDAEHSSLFDNEDWQVDWSASDNCLEVFKAIRDVE
jgi:hypothetical protein